MNKRLLTGIKCLMIVAGFAFATQIHAQISVTSFTPITGAAGGSITITGTGFNTTAANNVVFFGNIKATATTASATSLTVTIPVSVNYGRITVVNTGTNRSAISTAAFTPAFSGSATISAGDFLPVINVPVSGTAQGAAELADMDGDGKTDVVFATRFNSTISIMRNTGPATDFGFATQAQFSTLYEEPTGLALADMDGDGKIDMVAPAGNLNNEGLTLFRNTSTPASLSFTTNGYVRPQSGFAAVGDFDGDGKPDVIVRGNASYDLAIMRNTTSGPGNITLDEANTVYTTGNGWYGVKVSVADIDGDGKQDIISGFTNKMVIFRNTSTGVGNISFDAPLSFNTALDVNITAVGDFNGDGKIDVATMRNYGLGGGAVNYMSVFQNTTTGGTISFTRTDYDAGDPTNITVTDFNGDGKADLYVSNTSVANGPNAPTFIFQNTSTASTVSFNPYVAVGGVNSTGLLYFSTAGDLNKDGKPEAIGIDNNLRIYTMGGILPVQLTSFSASQQINNTVKLEWSTAEESGIDKYEIQRSIDGRNFSSIASVKANNVNNSRYATIDEQPQKGTNWYRLLIRSKDNNIKYSSVVMVKMDTKGQGIVAYPNPVTDGKLNIQINAGKGDYSVRLVSATGMIVWSTAVNHNGGSMTESFALPTVAKGIYTLRVIGSAANFSQSIVIN